MVLFCPRGPHKIQSVLLRLGVPGSARGKGKGQISWEGFRFLTKHVSCEHLVPQLHTLNHCFGSQLPMAVDLILSI